MAKRLYFKDYYYLQGNHVHIHGVGGLKLPSGDTVDRPEAMESIVRYNAELNQYEFGTNNSLLVLHSRNDGTATFYSSFGGELKGDLVIKDHRIQNNPGTSLAPAYTFYNDNDTGLNSTAPNTVDIVVGGSINPTPALTISRVGSGDNDQTVVVNGDLIVKGTQTNINSTDLYVEDQIITLNKNGTAAGQSGIEIEADGSVASKFVYDFSTSKWSTAGKLITDVPAPSSNVDVTNKQYVDVLVQTTDDAVRADMNSADQNLDNKITDERNRAIARENELQSDIEAEEDRAIARENELQSDIEAEEDRAIARENQLDVEKEDRANKSQPNGYASLDGDAQVPKAELPEDTLYANVATASVILLDDSVAGVNGTDVQAGIDDLGTRIKSIEDGNLNQEAVQDITGAMVSGNDEQGITVSYDDANGKLNFNVHDFILSVDGDMSGSTTVSNLTNTTLTLTLNDEAVQDIVGAMVSGNSEQGIAVSYDDVNGKLDFDVSDFDITLGGDLTGSATVTDLSNVFITTTLNPESVQDVVGNMVSGNTEKGIVVTYNDTTNKLDFDVNDFNITLNGDVSGIGSVVDLNSVTINTTINSEVVQDSVGDMVTGNVENGIVVTYDDANGKLNFDVNDFTITLTGGVTGNATVTDLGDVTIATTLDVEAVQDAIGDMLTGNTTNGITVLYDDTNNKINFDVDDFDITLNGDTTGTATVSDLGDVTITTTLSETLSGDHTFTGTVDVAKLAFNIPDINTDPLEMYRVNLDTDQSELRLRIGDNNTGDDSFAIGTRTSDPGSWQEAMQVKNNGDVRIAGNLNVTGTITGDVQSNINWSQITDKPDPTITLSGDLSGTVTLTDVGDGTLNATIDPMYNLILVPTGGNYPSPGLIPLGVCPISAFNSPENPGPSGLYMTGVSVLEDRGVGSTPVGFQMVVNWNNELNAPSQRPAIRTKDDTQTEFGQWRELAWFDEVEKGTFEYKLETTITSGASLDITKADIFGGVDLTSKGIDFRDVRVDVKVLDTDGSSPTNNMWVSASAVSTYGVDATNELVRIINEYTSSLQFYIRITL